MVKAGSVFFAVAIDAVFVALGVIGVVMIAGSVLWAKRRQKHQVQPRRTDGWRRRTDGLSAAGREVIDLTANDNGADAVSGLTVNQLTTIESKLDLLVAQIHDAQAIAPTPEDEGRMKLAEMHATSLNETVRTMRRVRLTSVPTALERFDTLGLQLAAHRSALEDVLRGISRGTGKQR